MPFFKSRAADAGPGEVFTAYPDIYRRWSELREGHGFTPMSAPVAKQRAEKRVRKGYVNLYPAFAARD